MYAEMTTVVQVFLMCTNHCNPIECTAIVCRYVHITVLNTDIHQYKHGTRSINLQSRLAHIIVRQLGPTMT